MPIRRMDGRCTHYAKGVIIITQAKGEGTRTYIDANLRKLRKEMTQNRGETAEEVKI